MPNARIATEAPEASSVEAKIARLRGLDVNALRARWRMSFGRKAPPHLARHLLFAMLAYRLQAEVMGDLDAETVRFLKQIDLTPSKQAAARGRAWLEELVSGTATIEQIAARQKYSLRHVNMTISPAFIAPALVKAAIEGRLPRGIGVAALRDAPAEWSLQFERLGLAPS